MYCPGVSLRTNWLAVRRILFAWFDDLEEIFSYEKKFGSKSFAHLWKPVAQLLLKKNDETPVLPFTWIWIQMPMPTQLFLFNITSLVYPLYNIEFPPGGWNLQMWSMAEPSNHVLWHSLIHCHTSYAGWPTHCSFSWVSTIWTTNERRNTGIIIAGKIALALHKELFLVQH